MKTYYLAGASILGSGLGVFKITEDLDSIKTVRVYAMKCHTEEAVQVVESMDWTQHVTKGPNAYSLTKEKITEVLAKSGLASCALFTDSDPDISWHVKVWSINKKSESKRGWSGSAEVEANKKVNVFKERDAFFTNPDVAARCLNTLHTKLYMMGVSENKRHYIEPSAGSGSFYNLLPEDCRTGLDIEPMCPGVEKCDFLKWNGWVDLKKQGKTMVAVGNPPFGYRAKVALQFLCRLQLFCDVSALILPKAFGSPRKTSPARRVMGYRLAYSEDLDDNSFFWPDGKKCNPLPSVFQIWVKPEFYLGLNSTRPDS